MTREGWSFPVDSERVHYFRTDTRTDAQRRAAIRRAGGDGTGNLGEPQQRSLCGRWGIDHIDDPWERPVAVAEYTRLGMLCGTCKRLAPPVETP